MDRDDLTMHITRWLNTLRSDKTKIAYRKGIEYLTRYWPRGDGRTLLDATSSRLAMAANAYLKAQQPSARTFNCYTSCWMNWCRYLFNEGIIDTLPKRPERIHVDEDDKPVRAVPTSEEVERVWSWLWSENGLKALGAATLIRERAMFVCLAFAGLRRSEVSKATVASWDESARLLTVQGKRNKVRTIVLPKNNRVVRAMRDACAGKGIDQPIVGIHPDVIYVRTIRLFETICNRPKITPHSLRNFLCERLWKQGLPGTHIMRIMGHNQLQTTAKYDLSRFQRHELPDFNFLEDDDDDDDQQQALGHGKER